MQHASQLARMDGSESSKSMASIAALFKANLGTRWSLRICDIVHSTHGKDQVQAKFEAKTHANWVVHKI